MRAAEFFFRARKAFDVPVGFAGPDATPRHDQQDGDPAAIAAVCPVRPAAARCASDRFLFRGGKIDASDESPTAGALRDRSWASWGAPQGANNPIENLSNWFCWYSMRCVTW
jgi:hypothetical protein